jgi:hypothetical protein
MAKLNIFYILRILKNLKIKITVVTTNNHPADPLKPTNVPPSDPVASTNIPKLSYEDNSVRVCGIGNPEKSARNSPSNTVQPVNSPTPRY